MPINSTPVYEVAAWLVAYIAGVPVSVSLSILLTACSLVILTLSYIPLILALGFVNSGALGTIINYLLVFTVGIVSSYARNRRKRIRFLRMFGPEAVARRKNMPPEVIRVLVKLRRKTFAEEASIMGPKTQKHVSIDYVRYVILGHHDVCTETPLSGSKNAVDQADNDDAMLILSANGIYRLASTFQEASEHAGTADEGHSFEKALQRHNRSIQHDGPRPRPRSELMEIKESQGYAAKALLNHSGQTGKAFTKELSKAAHQGPGGQVGVKPKWRRRLDALRSGFYMKILCIYDSPDDERRYVIANLPSVVGSSQTGFLTIFVYVTGWQSFVAFFSCPNFFPGRSHLLTSLIICGTPTCRSSTGFILAATLSNEFMLDLRFRSELITIVTVQTLLPALLFVWFRLADERLQKRRKGIQSRIPIYAEYLITYALHVFYMLVMVMGLYYVHTLYMSIFSLTDYDTIGECNQDEKVPPKGHNLRMFF
jgi:flagellar biosynthesis protein FliQ